MEGMKHNFARGGLLRELEGKLYKTFLPILWSSTTKMECLQDTTFWAVPPMGTVSGLVTSKIKFPNNCSMEFVFSDDLDRFKHMDAVIFNFIKATNPPKGRVLLTSNPN